MRKVFFFFIVLCCTMSMVFGQLPNSEIHKIIMMSKEANVQNGISDPDKIFPGQKLTFVFEDEYEQEIYVEHGDNQWNVIKNKLVWDGSQYRPVVDPAKIVQLEPQQSNPDSAEEKSRNLFDFLAIIPWYVWLLVSLLILWGIVSDVKDKRNVDPVTAGTPQVPGGVTDQRVYQRMRDLVAQRYPSARIEIKNIRRGWLSGSGKVFYAEGKSKKINLKNVAAYAGEILVNSNKQMIYFLQGCGNDARVGNYMFGSKFVFTPNVIINSDGSESPLPVTKTGEPNQQLQVAPNLGSEFFQNSTSALGIVGKFLEGNDAKHKVTIKVTHDSVEAIIENRFDQKQTLKNSEKKEDQK